MITNTKIKVAPPSGATLLWTNPSQSSWAGGVVTLESGYSYYMVEFHFSGNQNFYPIALLAFTETVSYFASRLADTRPSASSVLASRQINYVRDGEISFGNGYQDSSGSPNSYLMNPLRIWGVK